MYSLLASWKVCEVQAKCCFFPWVNLICSRTNDYVGNEITGGKIQRRGPYLLLSDLQADKQQLHTVVLLHRDCLNPGLNNHGLDC